LVSVRLVCDVLGPVWASVYAHTLSDGAESREKSEGGAEGGSRRHVLAVEPVCAADGEVSLLSRRPSVYSSLQQL
jgi:hypothetical protein